MREFVAKAGRVGALYTPMVPAHSFTLYQTGRGIGTETCWVNDVFPPDDRMFSALGLKLAYVIYTFHYAVFTVDTLPWDVLSPDLQLRIMDLMLEYMDYLFYQSTLYFHSP